LLIRLCKPALEFYSYTIAAGLFDAHFFRYLFWMPGMPRIVAVTPLSGQASPFFDEKNPFHTLMSEQ
jgi:hypothetical protein